MNNNNNLKQINKNELQKIMKKAIGLVIVATLGFSGIVGCASESTNELDAEYKETPKLANEYPEELESKIFEPYQHVYFKRYDLLKLQGKNFSKHILGGQIEVPEGYEIIEIENYEEQFDYGSRTRGFDVWYINTSTVECQLIYNESTGIYDYSEPGKVIQLEEESAKVLEKTINE